MSESPRWTLIITPTPDGEVRCSYAGRAEGVTRAEVVHHLVQALGLFTNSPTAIMPTEEQVKAHAARQKLLRDNPATTIYVRDGYSIFVGPLPVEAEDRLKAAGWVNGGAVPSGCNEPCLFVTEPSVFETVCGG